MLRYEYKYIVPWSKLDKLREQIGPFMELDQHAGGNGGEYTVRSIYFDTPDMECYFMKMTGVKRRNKVRIRGYNLEKDDNLIFFELKKKRDEPLYKNRAGMKFDIAKRIFRGEPVEGLVSPTERIPEAVNNARRFMYHIHARMMRPVVTVIYEREPYQAILKDRGNDLRITFDKNLRAVAQPVLDDLFHEDNAKLVNPGYFIMEVKFNLYLPTWVKALVGSLELIKGSASKYAMCVDAHADALTGAGLAIKGAMGVHPPRISPSNFYV